MNAPDERSRRFKATIDLSTGRASVRETFPKDRRPQGAPLVGVPRRAPPPESAADAGAPVFPWQRDPVAEQPQPQDAPRHNFPGAPAEPGVHVPARATAASLPEEDVEQICNAVVERLRDAFGLPPEEPPIPLLEPDALMGATHVAGAFMGTAETPAPPAGAFTEAVPAQHPAGSFAETG